MLTSVTSSFAGRSGSSRAFSARITVPPQASVTNSSKIDMSKQIDVEPSTPANSSGRVDLARPVGQRHDVAVRDGDALGPARRARGVDRVGQERPDRADREPEAPPPLPRGRPARSAPRLGQQRQAALLGHQAPARRSRPGSRPGAPSGNWDRAARRSRRPAARPAWRPAGPACGPGRCPPAPPAPRPPPAAAPPCGPTAPRSPGRSAAPRPQTRATASGVRSAWARISSWSSGSRGCSSSVRLKPTSTCSRSASVISGRSQTRVRGLRHDPHEQGLEVAHQPLHRGRLEQVRGCTRRSRASRPSPPPAAGRGRTWPCRSPPARASISRPGSDSVPQRGVLQGEQHLEDGRAARVAHRHQLLAPASRTAGPGGRRRPG